MSAFTGSPGRETEAGRGGTPQRLPVAGAVRQAQTKIAAGEGRQAALLWLASVTNMTYAGAVDLIRHTPEQVQQRYDALGEAVAATRAQIRRLRSEGHPGRRG